MKLIVGTLIIAIAVGYLAGGRLSNLANLQIRWAPLALIVAWTAASVWVLGRPTPTPAEAPST